MGVGGGGGIAVGTGYMYFIDFNHCLFLADLSNKLQ